ncbi:flagellar basal body-associated protein FliL [Granulicella aggregans]|uniref:Flagellar basal body-associated protein FliL n=1 Tax=Granulicella aggregans TaxID=474949 RepID=A0A7W8E6S9_9BACT|nr:hypothetical protein [Granulicella aggregans]MBB5060991.1 flagellar basal body-associated protein FliL [Granulicella aggregans]
MSNPIPGDERILAEQREALRRKEEAEEKHRDRIYQLERDKHELEKQKAAHGRRSALLGVIATLIVGLIAAGAAIAAAFISLNKKTDPTEPGIVTSIIHGAITSYKIYNSNTPLAEAVPQAKAPKTTTSIAPPATTQQAITTPTQPEPATQRSLCSGLSLQNWALGPAQVKLVLENGKFIGYRTIATLQNISAGPILVAQTGGTMTDNVGNNFGLSDSTLGGYMFGRPSPTVIDPGVSLQPSFGYRGRGTPGQTASFDVKLSISVDGGKNYISNTLTCSPVLVPEMTPQAAR